MPETAGAQADLRRFTHALITRYFVTIRASIRETAPGHHYLWPRVVHNWDLAGQAREIAAAYCDVLSVTSYTDTFGQANLPRNLDVPLLIGEIGFGALDGRLLTGQLQWMMPVAAQEERAAKWRAWLEATVRDPQVIGVHWFTYQDQPLTGRHFDGENYPFGFVSLTDRPYKELIDAQRATTGAA